MVSTSALVAVAALVVALALIASIGGGAGVLYAQPTPLHPAFVGKQLPSAATAAPSQSGNGGWQEVGNGYGNRAGPAPSGAAGGSGDKGGSSVAGAFLSPHVELASCGDGTCNSDETCRSCTADCGCAAADYCTDHGNCEAREYCGDGVCTQLEGENANCCTDCGCGSGDFCNYADDACVAEPAVDKRKLDVGIKSFIASSPRAFTDYTVYYEVFKGQPVTVANFVCDSGVTGKDCRTVVYFDSAGKVLLVGNSK